MASPTSSSDRPVPRDRLAGISLCVLVEGGKTAAAFERLVTSLFTAGVGMLQIRDKLLPDAVLLDRVRMALTAARRHDPGAPPLVTVNDRVGLVAASGADGVHVGAGDVPVPEARRLLGADVLVGRTAHAFDEARLAVAAGADYLGVGPCF